MAPQKKDFIGFMLAVETDKKLTKDFLAQKDAAALHEFFVRKGFTDISEDNCRDIIKFEEGARVFIKDVEEECGKGY